MECFFRLKPKQPKLIVNSCYVLATINIHYLTSLYFFLSVKDNKPKKKQRKMPPIMLLTVLKTSVTKC